MNKELDKAIRVIHVLRSLEFGGAEKLVLDLAGTQKGTTAVNPFLVCVKSLGPLAERARELDLDPTLVGLGRIKFLSAIHRLIRLFSRLHPDIVHTHNLVAHTHAAPAARLAGIPVVHTKHGKGLTSFSRAPFLRRFLYHLADRLVVVSRETGESFQRKAGVDPDRMVVIYNGIDTSRFPGSGGAAVRDKLGIADGTRVVGAVSRLDPVKDHATMLKAFRRASRRYDDCVLLIVGDGPERGRIEKLIAELGLEGKVLLPGFSGRVPDYLAAIDLFLQPSTEEGLSLTILEAAAAGVPVVATPVGGTPEIIEDGISGLFVEVGDVESLSRGIIDFLENPEPFRERAQRARRKIEQRFSLSSMTSEYQALYEDVLKRRGRA
ncbi:MAG: glycosyltransferase [Candidatus Krumholzibacteriota bacterium]|nr:glycosyltransferase [Candidatus Krumholzibacteriota bacterium]